ncbi:gliding motility-associated C-terminal domain-containing protein [Aridibaculum aurantiacum]|uniref:T9SS type B sorting domain-containing protein n=1 Tax=Aridibaculum aurantiacum TaxID=2810307 RepID=UPI001A97655F|nr:gliding motility-associated C-terminal domain-containing protein [Aridibaculum aurantiacum]
MKRYLLYIYTPSLRSWRGLILLLFLYTITKTNGQECPPNIDFEAGNFTGWTCYTGTTHAAGTTNVMALMPVNAPVPGQHTIYRAGTGEVDPYGRFPVTCPNGSGYSVKLGNDMGGGQAEGIAYQFTIPANNNNFQLIYHYAVVFEAPRHQPHQQPRMETEVLNVTDNRFVSCATFSFIAGSALPGFQHATNTVDTTEVLYKDWSAVSVDLSGLAGKTIRLIFKTADCTFERHFGYAYIDVNSECSSTFVGANFCPDDTAVNVVAPYGYQFYTWYDSAKTTELGTGQVLTMRPPPASGTTVAVSVVPYSGYGCEQTFYAQLMDTLSVRANAGNDTLSCNRAPVQIGKRPIPGLVYRWEPATGLSDPYVANPMAAPDTTTTYVLYTSSSGGGCKTSDTVVVTTSYIDKAVQLIGKEGFCQGSGDSAVLEVAPQRRIQWLKDGVVIPGATTNRYKVNAPGVYSANIQNVDGCAVSTIPRRIVIETPATPVRYADEYALENQPLQLNARRIGSSVSWSPGFQLNNRNSFTPIFNGTREQLYTIDIRTINECKVVDTLLVRTVKQVEIIVPTAFTPNNDGRNDLIRPILYGVRQLKTFKIFNRWGQIMYETNQMRSGWNGMFKGLQQPPGTYVWIAEAIGVDGKNYSTKGSFVLLR